MYSDTWSTEAMCYGMLILLVASVRITISARQIRWFGGVSHQKSFLSHQILPLVAQLIHHKMWII